MGKGTRQVIKYEEELVENMPAMAQNAIVSVANKSADNVLHIMTALVVALHLAMLQNPAANLLCTLLKVANALIIK